MPRSAFELCFDTIQTTYLINSTRTFTMERLEVFCNQMRDHGYQVGYSMSSYLQKLRSARAEVVHYSEPVFDYEVSGGSYACYTDGAVSPYHGQCIKLHVRFDGPKGRDDKKSYQP